MTQFPSALSRVASGHWLTDGWSRLWGQPRGSPLLDSSAAPLLATWVGLVLIVGKAQDCWGGGPLHTTLIPFPRCPGFPEDPRLEANAELAPTPSCPAGTSQLTQACGQPCERSIVGVSFLPAVWLQGCVACHHPTVFPHVWGHVGPCWVPWPGLLPIWSCTVL